MQNYLESIISRPTVIEHCWRCN